MTWIGDVGILARDDPRALFDDRHAAAEAAIRLRQFQPDIAAAEHDQMCRQMVELEGLDVGERPGRLEACNVRNGCMCANIDEHLLAGQHARTAIVEADLKGFRCGKAPRAHDQFGAAGLVVAQVNVHEVFHHGAFALADRDHVDRDGAELHAEVGGMAEQMRDLGGPDLILAGKARDVRAGTADPAAFHHGGAEPGFGQVPRKEFAAGATAEDQDVVVFRHDASPCRTCGVPGPA